MSDVEENTFEGRESRSQSKSPAGSTARVKSESRSGSRSPSRNSKRSESRSRSRSKSRSRSRRHSHRRYTRSRSRSRSHRRRSRSRSYTPEYRRRRSRSHSPMSNRRRHTGSREVPWKKSRDQRGRGDQANPDPNTCLGVFGLSLYTTERDLREVFSRYGPLAGVNVVYDQRTGRSRGFAFVYFERIDDSKEAMERANGMELDGRRIRVDYSITKRAHTPTPGIYMGRPTHGGGGGGGGGRRRESYYDRGYDRYDRYDEYDYRYRRRSPSPYYSRYRSRSRSRSYSPRRY
ncbi:transformer-2 protein homolog alpha isoform X2 [Latimeria chalumnae]|uniref:Transformer-2 protein homolog alpha n=1 Tax=Latimeria chalumnae TaxID=7897 RepID=H3B4D7_LATCH|nr:PREDICTED: transformer-2 protein homolog alpha isoform X2 [Latimeria chalumnae]|eukprot:XP_005997166.1 PREDICTED: transformer-2 protein homolog alpha isoform X2 [Latimeria chalumnae]